MLTEPPLSSCGYGIDLLRSCYRTKMRFGSTAESERWVQWYFVDEAQPLPVRTIFGSLNWADDAASPLGPGEVVGAPRIWVDGKTPAWPAPAQYCGSADDWANGFGLGVLPELPLDPETGRPECCAVLPPIVTSCCPAGVPQRLYVWYDEPGYTDSPRSYPIDYDADEGAWIGLVGWQIGTADPNALFRLECINDPDEGLVWRLSWSGCADDFDFNLPVCPKPAPDTFPEIVINHTFFGDCTGGASHSILVYVLTEPNV